MGLGGSKVLFIAGEKHLGKFLGFGVGVEIFVNLVHGNVTEVFAFVAELDHVLRGDGFGQHEVIVDVFEHYS